MARIKKWHVSNRKCKEVSIFNHITISTSSKYDLMLKIVITCLRVLIIKIYFVPQLPGIRSTLYFRDSFPVKQRYHVVNIRRMTVPKFNIGYGIIQSKLQYCLERRVKEVRIRFLYQGPDV